MASTKRGVMIASTLFLAAIMISACNQPYSQQPAVTNTPVNSNSLFATALGNPTGMSDVETFATQTALAGSTSLPGIATSTPISASGQTVTVTSTPLVVINPTFTPTATLAVSGPTLTPLPAGSRPSTYTLQAEEFPYCIARRYNLDPDSLLVQNQLSSGTVFYAGVVLNLSNVASPFPGVRALRSHPTTYTVSGNADNTVYGVACKFGDLDPSAIVSVNSGITLNSTLNVGQSLSIP